MDWKEVESRPQLDSIPENDIKFFEGDISTNINKNTVSMWGRLWLENLKGNSHIDFNKYSAYQFKDKFKGETAFLVGAAPSLKNNINDLKNKKGHIMTCGHALKFVMENGIKPEFVFVIDSHEKQKEWVNIGDDSKDINLVVPITVHPEVVKNWKGNVFFFRSIGEGETQFQDHVKNHSR